MKHDAHFEGTTHVPVWSTPAEARERLGREIGDFVSAVAIGDAETDAVLALRVTAGLGKTTTTMHAIARHGDALLARGHVLIYMPTLDLAARAHKEFQALAPSLPSRVIRGRGAQRADDSQKTMCERADIARKISSLVPSVTQALCRGLDPEGKFVQSPCASGCPYLAQKDVVGPQIVFLSHAYLTIDPPIDRDYPSILRVVDEKVWPTLARTSYLSIEDLMKSPPKTYPENLYSELTLAKSALLAGLQRALPLHEHLRSVGLNTEKLRKLANAENDAQTRLDIGPWQTARALAFRVETFDTNALIASRRRRRIFERLAERETGYCVGLKLVEVTSGQASQHMIASSWMEAVPRDAPLLLMDADADRDITERIAPGAAFISIQSPPSADIVQVTDRTLSNSWLLHPEKGFARRAAVLKILGREVDRAEGGGCLVVATKSVLAALHADAGHAVTKSDDEGLRQPLLGAVPRWFGPKTQGVNDFERFTSVVIIGRLQFAPADIEASARAVFSQDTLPIAPHSGPLPEATSRLLMADGSTQEAVVRAHPDPRAQAILCQSRECGTLQAIARLRLLSPNCEKRVVVLSNLPLPDFPVTKLATFAALERGLEDEADLQGYVRMERALRATEGRPVRGARLSALGLAADLPRDFAVGAARFRRGRSTSHLLSLCQRIATANDWLIAPLILRRPGGGNPVPAIILENPEAPLAAAKSLWPNLTPQRL